jgi:ferredoxin-thioredoxin reductase catalytic subunit
MSDFRDRFWYIEYARKHGHVINPDSEIVTMITDGLDNSKRDVGVRYCPCRLEKTLDSVCPCLEFRTTNHCHCGLFIE